MYQENGIAIISIERPKHLWWIMIHTRLFYGNLTMRLCNGLNNHGRGDWHGLVITWANLEWFCFWSKLMWGVGKHSSVRKTSIGSMFFFLYENLPKMQEKKEEEKEYSIIIYPFFCVEKIIKFWEELFFESFLPHLDFAFSLVAISKWFFKLFK